MPAPQRPAVLPLGLQRPAALPLGLHLSRTARVVGRAFDQALAAAGGSLPVWLVLLNVKLNPAAKQRELAAAVGVTEATLTHHLTALEREGLLVRKRDDANRRVQTVELTAAGEQRFLALREAAIAFDQHLKQGLTEQQLEQASVLMERLITNAAAEPTAEPPWSGLIDGGKK